MNNEEEKKEYIKLPPYRRWVMQNFPFIENDFDEITLYGMICKMGEYLDAFQHNIDYMYDELNGEILDKLKEYIDTNFNDMMINTMYIAETETLVLYLDRTDE